MKAWMKSTYQRIHAHLPERMQQFASDVAFSMPNRPFIYHDKAVHPPEGLPLGAVSFSIDFELAWATRFSRTTREHCVAAGLRERAQVPGILAAMDEYRIPATWATVGHLFLAGCQREPGGLAHMGMARVGHFDRHWKFSEGDWFQHDPCTDMTRDPAWYAPDLVEAIMNARAGHEIGCHTFSHIGFGPYCPPEVAAAELDACIEAMKPFNLRPVSFVFPGNESGMFDILAAKGFTSVRWFPVPWAEVSLPIRREEGLWAIHSSTFVDIDALQMHYERRLARLKCYVDRAIETHLAAHFWFHPSIPRAQMEQVLFPLFQYCAEKRDKGLVTILTMEQLAQATERARMHEKGVVSDVG